MSEKNLYEKSMHDGPLKGKELLFEIIKTHAHCGELPDRDCWLCPIREALKGVISTCDERHEGNTEIRYKKAVEIYVKEYGKEDLMEILL